MLHADATCHIRGRRSWRRVKVGDTQRGQNFPPLRQAHTAPSVQVPSIRYNKEARAPEGDCDLLVRFVSLPLDDGLRPTYPVSTQLSIRAPVMASGDDEPDDMLADGRRGT